MTIWISLYASQLILRVLKLTIMKVLNGPEKTQMKNKLKTLPIKFYMFRKW
jgi:hypothetical protein